MILKRREFLALTGAGILTPAAAFAVTGSQAEALIEKAIGDINAVIASGKSEAAMIRDFEGIFVRYADVQYVAGSALGPDARRASNSQRRAFVAGFQKYLANRYGRRFREFIGGKIEIVQSRSVNNFIEVETTAKLRGQSPFRVDFWVSDRIGRPAFFNIIIEGVNMINQERAEIGAMLDARGGDLDALTAHLNTF